MSREITKHGTIKSTDSDRRIAHGVALVPDEVDHQGDWLQPSAIERLSDDYMKRLSAGQADQGVMHVKFEESDISLAESRVLDSPDTIGGEQYPAGTWELGFKIHDADLWNLVAGENPVLSGFSIGGAVDFGAEQSVEDLPPDVTVPEDVDLDGKSVTEIIDGKLREVSLVDLPAVPRARVATIKSLAELEKAIDPSMTHDEIVEQLEGRGLDEAQRARLASYLKKTVGTMENETTRMSTQNASGGGNAPELTEEDITLWKRLTRFMKGETDDEDETEKVGRTLRDEIQERLRIAHDEIESSLAAEDDQFKPNRFTDDSRYPTNIDEKAKAAEASMDELGRAITDLKTAKSLAILKQDVDPDAGTPSEGDAVRWESDAGGDSEPADVRYGVVIDGLQDVDGEVKVAVYQPNSDGDGWEPRGEENDMNVENLEPIGSDGVGSLPPVDQVKAVHTFNEPAESGADATEDMTDKSDTLTKDEVAELRRLLNKSDTDDDENVENPDDSTRADGVEAEDDEGDSPEVEDGTRADGVEQQGEPDSGETEDGTRADGVDAEGESESEDGDGEKARDEPPEWAKELSEAVQSNSASIESLAKASGYSQQLAADATKAGDGEDEEIDEDARKAAFLGF